MAGILPASPVRCAENPFFAMDTGTKDATHKTAEAQAVMLRELGYAGIAYTGFKGIPELLKQLDANGLKLFAVYAGVSLDEGKGKVGGLEEALAALRGRDTIIWLYVTSSKYAVSSPAGDERAAEVLRPIADLAAEAKLRIALYPHATMWVERVEDAVRVAKMVDRKNVGVTFNLCHWLNEHREDGPTQLLKESLPYLFVVTINGAEAGGQGWGQLIQTLDRGSFENARFLATLRQLGYEGPIGLQGYGIGGDVRSNLECSMKAWRSFQAKIASGEAQPMTEDWFYQRMHAYKDGESRASFSTIRSRFMSAEPKTRAEIESRLIDILKAPDTTLDAKREVCRVLREWGTNQSVPVLSELLSDEKLSHLARGALQGKAYPDVDQALRDALGRLPDELKPGVIATIGDRGDRLAVPALSQLATGENAAVACAAIDALGRIGGSQAAETLARARILPELNGTQIRARLRCADRMLADGEQAAAADVFKELLKADYSAPIRIAALSGLARADSKAAGPLVLDARKDADARLRKVAIDLAAEIGGAEVTQALAEELKSADGEDRIALIAALAARKDKTASSAVAQVSASGDETVRIEALRALRVLGDASHVKLLAEAAASGGKAGETAAETLSRLLADGVDEAIIRSIGEVEPKVRAVLVHAIADRRSPGAVQPLLKLAKDPEAAVRREALRALGLMAGSDQLQELLQLLAGAAEEKERQDASEMVLKVAKGMADRERRRQCLMAVWSGAGPAVRVSLLSIFGGLCELSIVESAMTDESAEVQDAAVRTLAAWPDSTPMETLRQWTEKSTREVQQILALRGYIRMLGLPSSRTPAEKLERYRTVLQKARRPEEKKLILNALGNVADFDVLALIEQQMSDASVQTEAETAYLKAVKLVAGMRPGEMQAEFQRMAAANKRFGERGQEVLDWLSKCDGHITVWLLSGPYTHPGSSLLDWAFPPEQADAEKVEWRPVNGADGPYTKFIQPGAINLGALVGGDECAAYLRTSVYSEEKRQAILQLGSDDSVAVWLNGKRIHSNRVARAVKPLSDAIRVELEKGWNTLQMKIVQGSGEWGACARFANLDGTVMKGLLVQPK